MALMATASGFALMAAAAAGTGAAPASPPIVGWFDLVALGMLAVGFVRGRKRGMSMEFMDIIQWLAIVGGGAVLYGPIGRFLSLATGFGPLFSFFVTYLLLAIVIKSICTLFKRSVGEKLVSGETFGSLEYYLGMGAGILRYACVTVFLLALLNARLYTAAQLLAEEKEQDRNFGDIRFPTWGRMQQAVFAESFTGRFVHQNAAFLLLEPTAPGPRLDAIKRDRDRDFNRSLGL